MIASAPLAPTVDLAAQVRRELDQSGYHPLRSVEVTALRDGVHLRGTVPTYYLKQMAQSVAMETDGVNHVVSEMEVP